MEVEMLDYSYVNECTDWSHLSAIVDVLKSGTEGYYPDVSLLRPVGAFACVTKLFVDCCD